MKCRLSSGSGSPVRSPHKVEEAYSRRLKQVVTIAEAVDLCISGTDDKHADFDCADLRCRDVPVLISSYSSTNTREPYVATCKQHSCHQTRCACGGGNAENPVLCHHDECEYIEPSGEGGEKRKNVVKAITMRLLAPEGLAIPRKSSGGRHAPASPSLRFQSGNFTLFNLVDWLKYQNPATIAGMRLNFENQEQALVDIFSQPRDLRVNGIDAVGYREQAREIYFGPAKIDLAKAPDTVRVQFDGNITWEGDPRPVSLFTNVSQLHATRKRQRFERMMAQIAASPSPNRCYAFILARINPYANKVFINLELGRGLEEVLLFPASAAVDWAHFDMLYRRTRALM